MKIYYALFLLCFLPSFLSQATEQGGIKIALNQQLIYSALNHFFGDLSKFLNDFEIPNIRFFRGCNARNVRGKIFNFKKNSLTFQFNANGIHLMLHNLRGEITTRVDSSFLIFPFHNNAKVSINDLSLDCTVKIVSKMKNGTQIVNSYVKDDEIYLSGIQPGKKYFINIILRNPISGELITLTPTIIEKNMFNIYKLPLGFIIIVLVVVMFTILGIVIYLYVREVKEEQKEESKFKSWFA